MGSVTFQATVSRASRCAEKPSTETLPTRRGAGVIDAEPLVTKTMSPSTDRSHTMSGPGSLVSPWWTIRQIFPAWQLPTGAPGLMSMRKPSPRSASLPAGGSGEPHCVLVT